MTKNTSSQIDKSLKHYRRFLAVAGSVYIFWWFAVEFLLPGSFNPFLSRLLVCAVIFGILILSYFDDRLRQRLPFLFLMCSCLITSHYFYLFYGNLGDMNWVIGAYITVVAINLAFVSRTELLLYSGFVLVCSGILVVLLPSLNRSVFFPGMVTILIQANLGMRNRLEMINILEESNRRFQLLFHSTFEGVLVHENGVVVNVNDALVRMFGFSRDEFIGMNVFQILDPAERDRAVEGLKLDHTHPYETKALTRNGAIIDVQTPRETG